MRGTKLIILVAPLAILASSAKGSGLPEFTPVKPYPLKGEIPGVPTPAGKTAIVVGTSHFTTWAKQDKLKKDIKKVARMHGLEHARFRVIKVWREQVAVNFLPITVGQPVTTYNTSSANIYSPYGGYVGTVYGNGTSTSTVPVTLDPGGTRMVNVTKAEILVEFIVWK
jgi:hypothetical protein